MWIIWQMIHMKYQNLFSLKKKKKECHLPQIGMLRVDIIAWKQDLAFQTNKLKIKGNVKPHFQTITKTCLYNFYPLKPHFYIVKLGFTGVYIIFLISAQNIDCGYSLEPPCRGGSNEYPQSMFWAEIWKISEFFIWKVSFFDGKIFNIFE